MRETNLPGKTHKEMITVRRLAATLIIDLTSSHIPVIFRRLAKRRMGRCKLYITEEQRLAAGRKRSKTYYDSYDVLQSAW